MLTCILCCNIICLSTADVGKKCVERKPWCVCVVGKEALGLIPFPTERKYQTVRRKFGPKSSAMLHLLSCIVPPRESQLVAAPGDTLMHISTHFSHIGLIQEYIKEQTSPDMPIIYTGTSCFFAFSWGFRLLNMGSYFLHAKLSSWSYVCVRVPSLFYSSVCCHKPNLHVDINSLWSLTDLMNADYASQCSDTCRSACACTYACIRMRTCIQTRTLGT